jgi:hypothetical protein
VKILHGGQARELDMSLSNEVSSIRAMVGDAIEQLGKLVGNEIELARAELSAKVAQAGVGLALLLGAAVLIIPALVIWLMALALELIQLGISPVFSYAIAAAACTAASIVLAMSGLNRLTAKNLMPTVTIQQFGADAAAAKEIMK